VKEGRKEGERALGGRKIVAALSDTSIRGAKLNDATTRVRQIAVACEEISQGSLQIAMNFLPACALGFVLTFC
jgi:hypothetical protein